MKTYVWRAVAMVVLCGGLGFVASAETQAVYSQPPDAAGGVLVSSKVMPDGSDSDMYVYDGFTLDTDAAITEVSWRGGYAYAAQYGRVQDFMVTFYGVIEGTSQPSLGYAPAEEQTSALAQYDLGSIAGETGVGVVVGIAMYDYHYTLSTPFQAQADTLYWIRIEAIQPQYPDWGIAAGTGGNGSHIRFSTGAAMFQGPPKDAAFTLYAEVVGTAEIGATASPPEGGTVTGAGSYAIGEIATLTATENLGFTFVDWTEGGVFVSNTAVYAFEVTVSRDLVANFIGGEGEVSFQTADQDANNVISLSELLRVIQFYNSLGLHCAENPGDTEDGFVPGAGTNVTCAPYDTDYSPQDWIISLSELLRVIQFYNSLSYHYCPADGTEDGYCPGNK